MHTCIIVEAP